MASASISMSSIFGISDIVDNKGKRGGGGYRPVSGGPSWLRKGNEDAVWRETQGLPLFGLEEPGDVEKQARRTPQNREGSPVRAVVRVEFARIGSQPL